ncbi:hypothetical protein C6502_08775 [Candidatus Poribacteria bacterium]|nr:MAG: hypothetical protein C6502_08775 [Candidatus Poribacteria bacterium]
MQARPYEIRDPIHGLIELLPKEVDIINTGVFQRLRRIRQLAMAFLVYPGTLHTRFEHSIGVMHIAGRICDRLKQLRKITAVEYERIRLAALLHDIGHGPFSHVSEHLLDKYAPKDGDSTVEKIHEKVTVDIINKDSEIGHVLTVEERQFVVEMIEGKQTRDFRRDIVSSDLDADKMDYLLRDSYFAGVKYGMYDLEKIIESFRVHRKGLAISDEGLHALEQLLLAKHHMTEQVYRHRVRSISDAMIIRGIELAIDKGNQELKRLYQYDGTPKFVENYMEYHDERLIDILRRCDQEKARNIFERLYQRKLFKMIGELSLKEVDDPTDRLRLLQMDDEQNEQKRKWEEQIAEDLEIDPDYVIVNKVHIRNPNYGSRSYSLNPEAIMIFDDKQRKLKNLSRYAPELFLARSPVNEADLETVQIYAPRDDWNALSTAQKQQEQKQLYVKVQRILLAP